MRNKILSQALSMESAGAAEASNTASMENALQLESATLSIEEAGHQVEMAGYEHEELESAATSLEGICTAIETSMESDEAGLTQSAAKGYSLAVQAVLGDALPNPVASMESFGGDTERRQATELSLESIQDTIKKIWEAIKRTVQKVISAVSDFFSKLFGGVEKAKKKAQELKGKVKDLKNASPKEDKFKAGGLSRVAIGGEVNKKVLMDGAAELMALSEFSSDAASTYGDYLQAVTDFFRAKKDQLDLVTKAVVELNDDFRKKDILEKETELPGGKIIMAKGDEKKEDKLPSLISPELADHPKAKSYKADKDGIEALNAGEIESLLDIVISNLEVVEKSKKVKEDVVKSQKDALAEADKFAQEVERGKLSFVEEAWDRAQLRWAMSRAKGGINSFISKVDRYAFSTARGYLSVAESAMENLGGKEEKEGDD